jgi:hypothetical protein
MLCPQCQSSNRREFSTEMMIHYGLLDGAILDLFTYPSAWVCLDCGWSTFTLAQNELLKLREGYLKPGANNGGLSGTVASDSGEKLQKAHSYRESFRGGLPWRRFVWCSLMIISR